MSRDKTHGIVSDFPDTAKKIVMEVGCANSQIEQRDKVFKYTDGYDWLMIVDDDEVYTQADLKKLHDFLKTAKDQCYRIGSYSFINSFEWFHLTHNMRLWRIRPGMHYIGSNNIGLEDDRLFYDKNKAEIIQGIYRYHYSYVRDTDRHIIKRKQCYGKYSYEVKNGRFFRHGLKLKKFNGNHPVIMRGHPYAKLKWTPNLKEWGIK